MTEIPNYVEVESLSASDYEALHAAATQSAVLELGARPTLKVTGPDRVTWLNGLLTCDVARVAPGLGAWGLLLDRLGKIQAVVGVLADVDQLYLAVLWGDCDVVMSELDARLVMEDAELTRSEEAVHWRLWLGPGEKATPSGAIAFGAVTLANDGLLAAFSGSLPPVDAAPVLSPAAWNVFRVQHGLPWGGVDFDATSRPHEAALERRAVSWSKGCYLGQEVVCMQDMRGKVKRSVRPFVAASAGLTSPRASSEVQHLDKGVGHVTTAVHDGRRGCYWIFARVSLSPGGEKSANGVTELRWVRAPEDSVPLEIIEPPPAPRA